MLFDLLFIFYYLSVTNVCSLYNLTDLTTINVHCLCSYRNV